MARKKYDFSLLKAGQLDLLLLIVHEYKTIKQASKELDIKLSTAYDWSMNDDNFKAALKAMKLEAFEERRQAFKKAVMSSNELAEIARAEAKKILQSTDKSKIKTEVKTDLIKALLRDEKESAELDMAFAESETLVEVATNDTENEE